MKLTAILSLCLALAIHASAQVFPASTNGNNTFTGTNTFTQRIVGPSGGIYTPTNSITQNINFLSLGYVEGVFQTNAAFAWLGYSGLVNTNMQTAVIWLTNTTGAAIAFTVPANTHTTGVLNVTNLTEIVVKRHPGWTNMFSLPLW